MTNWHSLPFELQTQILRAFINSMINDNGYVYHRPTDSIVIEHWSKYPSIRWVPSPKSDFVNFLLVAPELEQELLMLIQKKLSSATMFTEEKLDRVALLAAESELSGATMESMFAGFAKRLFQPIDKELHMLSLLKQQLANTGNVRNIAATSHRGRGQELGYPWANAMEVGFEFVNQQIKEAVEECGKL
jgi:hypothetical protein